MSSADRSRNTSSGRGALTKLFSSYDFGYSPGNLLLFILSYL